jgi:HAD superfamily hydrolase (TIGR01484 family)
MKPLAALTPGEAGALRGILFDLDDTVLTHGQLTRPAYDAVWSLHEAGLALVIVTGRPYGWGAILARQWPVVGCVTENGAIHAVRHDGRVSVRDPCDDPERQARRTRLARLVERVRHVVPEAHLADDNDARRSDVAWDIAEHGALADERIDIITSEISAAGARSWRSSVHLHATFEADDKASGALRFCARELACSPVAARSEFAFVGDSGNDAACFAAFRITFGVSNVRASLPRLTIAPRYVADRAMGDGFADIAKEVLRKR